VAISAAVFDAAAVGFCLLRADRPARVELVQPRDVRPAVRRIRVGVFMRDRVSGLGAAAKNILLVAAPSKTAETVPTSRA